MNNPIFENLDIDTAVDGDANVEKIPAPQLNPGELLIASLVAFDAQGKPLISHPLLNNAAPIAAITTLTLSHQHIGRQAALMFVNGSLDQPVIIGLIHSPLFALLDNLAVAEPVADTTPDIEIFSEPLDKISKREEGSDVLQVDGKRIVIQGQEEITLSCGEASITLTKAGKILLRGTYLQSRSSGVNRIMGGAVQIN